MTKRNKNIIIAIMCIIALMVTGCKTVVSGEDIATRTIYKIGDNTTTKEIYEYELGDYIDDSYEWSIEPTTLMYAADGRTSWIWNSEVEQYKKVCWSTYPPVTIYSSTGSRSVLTEEVGDYLATGVWFKTYEEANRAVFTYNVFQKSNLSVEQLNKILARTGLSGYGQSFYTMERTYGVNALFAIGVGAHESANFYKTANSNNFFGFRGSRGWMSFDNPDACIMYFGRLMNSKLYYGKTIEQIAVIYCDATWTKHVKAHMNEKWGKLN